ncbi:MAG: SDR family oxidoreductase [Chloroherpetonaceae bacterium]|nr:SDR family oxidoreductase [Chloroherpetonaceae bacterium]
MNPKSCFITGASGRLGKASAIALAREGWSVFFTFRNSIREAKSTRDEIRRYGVNSECYKCDISRPKEITRVFRACRSETNELHLAICNASNFFPTPLPDVTEKDFDALVDTNLKGTFFTMQEAAKWMHEMSKTESRAKKKNILDSTGHLHKHIVVMTDVSARLSWRRYAPYTAAKAGIENLIRVFAKEFAPEILVNGIAPGTLLLHEQRDKPFEDAILQKIPLQRLGSPEDVVKALMFLVSSDYITGQIITVDGGRMLY